MIASINGFTASVAEYLSELVEIVLIEVIVPDAGDVDNDPSGMNTRGLSVTSTSARRGRVFIP